MFLISCIEYTCIPKSLQSEYNEKRNSSDLPAPKRNRFQILIFLQSRNEGQIEMMQEE